jgi:hypothetical protein
MTRSTPDRTVDKDARRPAFGRAVVAGYLARWAPKRHHGCDWTESGT